MKTVAEVMAALPETLDPEATVHQAAQMMRDGDYGAVPIVDGVGSLVGIVTDRDIVVKAVAEGRDGDTPVRHCMSGAPDTVGTDTTVEQAMIVMTSRQIRRLPVVENDRLVGMVSLGDLSAADAPAGEKAQVLENVSASGERRPAGTTFDR